MRPLLMSAALFIAACAHPAPQNAVRLEQIWRVSGLAGPESAALSADGAFLYVSNVNGEGEARDGNGFISRVSRDGEILRREWASGFDAPKGLALRDGVLYVADIDQIVVLNATTGAVTQRHPAPGATFLNDLTIAPNGQVLIADSGGSRIYALKEGRVEIWLEHDLLDSINGLLPEPHRLLATTMQGRLLAIDYATHAISVLAVDLDQADGVAPLGENTYLVTAWPGQMFKVSEEGETERILDTRAEPRFLNDILRVGDTLYVPHWEPGELTAYRIRQ